MNRLPSSNFLIVTYRFFSKCFFRYYKLSADQDHGPARPHVNRCYANGIGTAKDELQAIKY